jgi:hypothetical protein
MIVRLDGAMKELLALGHVDLRRERSVSGGRSSGDL